ncbi:MAG: peptidoglycan DD-metalloendopeptidase family protein, partial [Thermoleophilia bacterium]|nr:peptidoglycan DD-metalloendopeptidase family protein [Thermoleophilia bacterium]
PAPAPAPAPAVAQAVEAVKAIYPVGTERVSDEFGATKGRKNAHGGTDFSRGANTEIKATLGGTVIEAKANGGWGNNVVVDHGNGLFTRYAHMIDGGILVKPGQAVKQGEVIGKVGSTGNSTGNHLHFEVMEGGTGPGNRRDPHVWLDTGKLVADKNPNAAH